MTEAPVFVVGVARSGTTLLASMLSSHSRLDCGQESRFFARFRHLGPQQQRRTLDAALWPGPATDFIASLRNQGRPIAGLFDLSIDDIGAWLTQHPPSLASMLESLTVLHAARAGKPRWVEKTPRHLLMTDTIRALWPEAAIVRIVRDPRDVALSLAGMPFAKESVVGNLVRVDHDDRASRERIESDPRAMTLRYEDLVTEPERELRRICEFIGEPYEAAMLDARQSAGNVAAVHEWWKDSVAGPVQTSRIGRWKQEMRPDVRCFAALHLAGYLREHGYEGSQEASAQVAIVPVADAVGPRNEQLLLDLARRDAVVVRPSPRTPTELHERRHLVFLGTRGQLDPSRGSVPLGRVVSTAMLAAGLLVRRLQGRPILWLRRATLRPRRTNDPGEWLLALMLRLLAHRVEPDELPSIVASRD
ncbi:MAG: sulfotransferase [Chloroflexota bacterium]